MDSLVKNGDSRLERFTSGGIGIRLETFPATPDGRASLLVLHGANGIRSANPIMAGLTEFLGTHGLAVHVLHYFDRTHTSYADDATIWKCFNDWLSTVDDALAHVRARFHTKRIALLGYSLGGYLSAAKAIQSADVAALVVLSGGIDPDTARQVRHAPPTLILHGGADRRVPLGEAERLHDVLKGAGGTPELKVYPGEGHTLQMASYFDALQRTTEFLRHHLGLARIA